MKAVFEKSLADAKAELQILITEAREDQDSIKQEIEALNASRKEEKDALTLQYEKLIEETKENEKVKKKKNLIYILVSYI